MPKPECAVRQLLLDLWDTIQSLRVHRHACRCLHLLSTIAQDTSLENKNERILSILLQMHTYDPIFYSVAECGCLINGLHISFSFCGSFQRGGVCCYGFCTQHDFFFILFSSVVKVLALQTNYPVPVV